MTQQQLPHFDPRQFTQWYVDNDPSSLTGKTIEILEYHEKHTYYAISVEHRYQLEVFLTTWLPIFCRPDYIVEDRSAERLIQLNPVISNLVAISRLGTTDVFLDILLQQNQNFVKLLTLYSMRNEIRIDYSLCFQTSPKLAALWYVTLLRAYPGTMANPTGWRNLQHHLKQAEREEIELHLRQAGTFRSLFFVSTYLDSHNDFRIKQRINASLQESELARSVSFEPNPDPRHIAVVSRFWTRNHSVYRILSQCLESLRDDYEVTLLHLGSSVGSAEVDLDWFSDVQDLMDKAGQWNLGPLRNHNYSMLIFPEVGMDQDILLLANLRIAPIQIACLGHSSSTGGAEIDYYVSGIEAELPENPEQNYSERLVLLPGSGAIHNLPICEPTGKTKSRDEILIACPWTPQKTNAPMIHTLRSIVDRAEKPVVLRFFPGHPLTFFNNYLPFAQDIERTLGAGRVEVLQSCPYPKYLELLEECDICIDSFPFGGCNTIADALWVRKPTVTWESHRWFGRIGSQMLRMIGLEDLIATSEELYVAKVTGLINDDAWRERIREQLQNVDLESTIFSSAQKPYFKKAIDYLIDNHERLQQENSREPIRFEW